MSLKSVIIVAGGSGKRMGTSVSKQFLLLHGKPILFHTIERFRAYDSEIQIVLVLPSCDISYWKNLCNEYDFDVHHTIVEGGNERFFSVLNGLNVIEKSNYIAIHDGVRPLLSIDLIDRCFKDVIVHSAVVPVIRPVESVRYGTYQSSSLLNRDSVFLVQTPQVFEYKLIKEAYGLEYDLFFTDDASVVQTYGASIHLIEGERWNIKITNPVDLKLAEFYCTSME